MDWLKNIFGSGNVPKSEDEIIDIFNSTPEEKLEAEARAKAQQEDIANKEEDVNREAEEQAIEGKLVVIDKAKIKMGSHLGEFKVLNDVPSTQNKLTATTVEKQIPNFTFYDGFQILSIDGDWQKIGTYQVQDNEVLLKESTIQVTGKMPGNSPPETGFNEFIDSGQINIPENPNDLEVLGFEEEGHEKCFCDRDFTVEEMIEIIYNIRDKQKMISKRDVFFDMGGERISELKISSGKLSDSENTEKILLFTNEMNSMFKKFKITTCKRKIHFLGQMYLETIFFRYTYESRKEVPKNYKGGIAFQGRGMKQITHDYNYLAYYDYINKTEYYKKYENYSKKDTKGNIIESVGECIESREGNILDGFDKEFYKGLTEFAKMLSQNLFHSFNSAGW